MKKILVCLIMIFAVVLTGCNKTGEKQSVEYIKKRLNIPDSFVKVNYVINKDTRLARLDYKAKNAFGVELPGCAYFRVSDSDVKFIDTDNVEKQILDYLESNHSADFEKLVKSYKRFILTFKDFLDEHSTKLYYIDNLDTKNYYSVRSFEKSSKKYNRTLKKLKDEYSMMPEDLKKFLNEIVPNLKDIETFKYSKVILTGKPGKLYIDWDYEWKQTDEYPD